MRGKNDWKWKVYRSELIKLFMRFLQNPLIRCSYLIQADNILEFLRTPITPSREQMQSCNGQCCWKPLAQHIVGLKWPRKCLTLSRAELHRKQHFNNHQHSQHINASPTSQKIKLERKQKNKQTKKQGSHNKSWACLRPKQTHLGR